MKHKTVGDLMSIAVVTVAENTPYKKLAQTLAGGRIGAAPVLDAAGRVVGVVSETDLLCRAERGGHRPLWPGPATRRKARAGTARALMTHPAITITPEATPAEAARRMTGSRITHLPVIDDRRRLVGIISRHDLLAVYLVPDQEIRTAVIHHVLGEHPSEVDVGVRDGVVDVVDELDYVHDDTIFTAPRA